MKKRILALILLLLVFISINYFGASAKNDDINNPFENMDEIRQQIINNAQLKKSKTIINDNIDLYETAGKRYIVEFKDDISKQEIYDIVKLYNYKLIGNSEQRMFMVEINDLNTFKQQTALKVNFIEEEKARNIQTMPDDIRVNDQWALPAIKMPEAWDISTGLGTVLVAVIDSGINRNHPDFKNSDIRNGWDYQNAARVENDTIGHGTNVSGIIGAGTNNGVGISGVNWNVAIVPFKITDEYDGVSEEYVCSAIIDAADMGCDVINLSLGGPIYSNAENSAVSYAISKGCIVVASAGNDGNSRYLYPASYNDVISVASIDSDLTYSYFSQRNNKVDVAAPGSYILSTNKSNSYSYVDGTSFSSPYVAGVAALAKAVNDDLNSNSFLDILQKTSIDKGTLGYDNYYGNGIVNAYEVLKATAELTPVSDFTYTVFDDTAQITGYTGTGGYISIPYLIEDKIVTSIADRAFYNISGINGVTIPNSVTSIGASAFAACQDLSKIVVWDNNSEYSDIDGVLFNKSKTNLIQFPPGKPSNSYTIPSSVNSIGESAFENCIALNSLQIWNNVTFIESNAFVGSNSLVIICNTGSYAEEFAILNNIMYMLSHITGLNAVSGSINSINLNWNAVPGASGYHILRSTAINGAYTWVGTAIDNSFANSGLTSNKTYYYKVRAYRWGAPDNYFGNYSLPVYSKVITNTFSGYQILQTATQGGTHSLMGLTEAARTANIEKKLDDVPHTGI